MSYIIAADGLLYLGSWVEIGIFCAPLIQTIINKVWFKNKEDDGIIHPEFLENDSLPMATIAFVPTVVSLFFVDHYHRAGGKLKVSQG